MKIHEYQAKALLAEFGVPVPRGEVVATPAQAREAAARLGGKVVLKAQVYAGGRGKAGGIKTAASAAEAEQVATKMLGSRLVTHQTTSAGVPVSRLLVEEAVTIQRELYLAMLVDGAARMPLMMASPAGGMDIEEVAATRPEQIIKVHIDPAAGFRPFVARKLALGLGLGAMLQPATALMGNLYRLFLDRDCSLAEINPLAVDASGRLLALDAKLNFDDNALYRHKELEALRDEEQEDPLEVQANKLGIRNYIKLDGNIGCMVNGAGLAMTVLDVIKAAGGSAANFLDIGTANNTDRVVNAFRIFTADPDVKAVLINIFGGMARVDVIANGMLLAHQQMDIRMPIVVRLAGTNVEEGKRILAQSGLKFIEAADLQDAATKAVASARRAA